MAEKKDNEESLVKIIVNGKTLLGGTMSLGRPPKEDDDGTDFEKEFLKAFARVEKEIMSDNIHSVTFSMLTRDGKDISMEDLEEKPDDS